METLWRLPERLKRVLILCAKRSGAAQDSKPVGRRLPRHCRPAASFDELPFLVAIGNSLELDKFSRRIWGRLEPLDTYGGRQLATRWQRLYGARHVDLYDGGAVADTGCGQLLAMSPQRAEARYAAVGLPMAQGTRTHAVAITLLAPDLARIEAMWREHGVPYGYNEHGLVVEPEFAGNVVLEFVNHPH